MGTQAIAQPVQAVNLTPVTDAVAGVDTDTEALLLRVTSGRATLFDLIDDIESDTAALELRLTAARAAQLDNLETAYRALNTGNSFKTHPSAANSPAIAAGGGAWSAGSWTQIIASTPEAQYLMGVAMIAANNGAIPMSGQLDIGVGAAASESIRATVPFFHPVTAAHVTQSYVPLAPFPILIPNATRLSGRYQCSTASQTIYVQLLMMDAADLEAF